MAKRNTVNVNCKNVLILTRKNEWSSAAFSRKVGKYSSWFGEVLRGNNLPSPEEAARMCILLHTTPEEILQATGETEQETAKCQADIALVRSLMEQQGIKEAPAAEGEGSKETMLSFIRKTDDRAALLAIISEASKKLQEME